MCCRAWEQSRNLFRFQILLLLQAECDKGFVLGCTISSTLKHMLDTTNLRVDLALISSIVSDVCGLQAVNVLSTPALMMILPAHAKQQLVTQLVCPLSVFLHCPRVRGLLIHLMQGIKDFNSILEFLGIWCVMVYVGQVQRTTPLLRWYSPQPCPGFLPLHSIRMQLLELISPPIDGLKRGLVLGSLVCCHF